jgi:DNA polymerase V
MTPIKIGYPNKYGKNSILKGTDFEKGAKAKERNEQIGGHKA